MQTYQIVINAIILIICLSAFIYSFANIFKKETSKYFVFLCLGNLCFIVEEIGAVVYAACGNGEITGNFQVSILGYIATLLFLFTASYAVLDKLIAKDEKVKKASLFSYLSFIPIIAVLVIGLIVCLNINRVDTFILFAIELLLLFPCAYFATKHCLLSKHSEVCKKTFLTNLTLLGIYVTNLLFALFYVFDLLLSTEIITLLYAIEFATLTLLCIKENKKWKI